jgi:hypothetical protein
VRALATSDNGLEALFAWERNGSWPGGLNL